MLTPDLRDILLEKCGITNDDIVKVWEALTDELWSNAALDDIVASIGDISVTKNEKTKKKKKKEKKAKIYLEEECVVCMCEETSSKIKLDCKHQCICSECFEKLPKRECPMCGVPFNTLNE